MRGKKRKSKVKNGRSVTRIIHIDSLDVLWFLKIY
jgi:hypothetical protein